MPILKLEFEDLRRPWHLLPVTFQEFNLLVGVSGVGKTKTLRIINQLGRAATGKSDELGGCRWTVDVETTAGTYTWTGETDLDPGSGLEDEDEERIVRIPPRRRPRFVTEQVRGQDGAILAHRTENELVVDGKPIPRLRPRDSIISLIEEEPIASLRDALGAIHFCRAVTDRPPLFDEPRLDRLQKSATTLDALKADRTTDLMSKAYVLKRNFPEEFSRVQEQMGEIFRTVEELDVGPWMQFSGDRSNDESFDLLVPAFRERGVEGWVDGLAMSNGMRRTLLHLLELRLEPPGSVLLIDEYENGMGVNCLPEVTRTLLDRRCDVQLIFTSHHPYVINNVSKDLWRIMRRTGHEVEVLRKGDVKRLDTASAMDGFDQLINAPEFTEGIS